MPKGIPLSTEDQNQRRHEVSQTALNLFFEKGFRETTMQEVARAAGMGKSTLYDYFKSKDEILVFYVVDEVERLTDQANKIAAQDLPAAETLRQVMLAHLAILVANKNVYGRLTVEVQQLKSESLRRIHASRHMYQDLLCRLIERAVEEGAFRPINPLLAVHTIQALLTPALFSSRPTGTPDQMLDEALGIFYYGVMRRD